MSDPFIGEIRIFGFQFAPTGWMHCDGQLLQVSQNTALFSILGTTYGGNGQTTFGLPDLANRVPIQAGQGKGLSDYLLGQGGGTATVTLKTEEIPVHNHHLFGSNENGTQGTLSGGVTVESSVGGTLYQTNTNANLVPMNKAALPPAGDGKAHNNFMPCLVLNYCIAVFGIFPVQS